MKKNIVRILLVAALVCVMSVTAFASLGGMDFIRSIFGESADALKGEVLTPGITAEADGRVMALEALVTDGYATSLVISLTGEEPLEEALFTATGQAADSACAWTKLAAFSTKQKTYYHVELTTEQRFDKAQVTVALNPGVAGMALTFDVENSLGNAVIPFPEGTAVGQVTWKELLISPMGFLLIGVEEKAQGGLPAVSFQLMFQGGKTEDADMAFAPSDETVGGGGGAVIGGGSEPVPLVTRFKGTRNPEGELVISGQFSRMINPATLTKVVLGGVDYPAETEE